MPPHTFDVIPCAVFDPPGSDAARWTFARVVGRPDGTADVYGLTAQHPEGEPLDAHPKVARLHTFADAGTLQPVKGRRGAYTLVTDEGPLLVVKTGGCACSSPLRKARL